MSQESGASSRHPAGFDRFYMKYGGRSAESFHSYAGGKMLLESIYTEPEMSHVRPAEKHLGDGKMQRLAFTGITRKTADTLLNHYITG